MFGRNFLNCAKYIICKIGRNRHFSSLSLVLVLVVCLCATVVLATDKNNSTATPGTQRWPLDLSERYLTSNFMEYRAGRFHAGLDFKTQTITGFPVYAVEDGWISRVRATPNAYGRAIYMQGVSGRTYVFAHLARFADFLREPVIAARKKSGRYRTRLEFSANRMPVKQGQILGLSGESGTNGPHLHFEVRDSSQRPQNPLTNGFSVKDSLAPKIFRIRAVPASPDALIAGENVACVLTTANSNLGLTGTVEELQIFGRVAFSAKIVDASDIRGHKLEPWLIEVILDGELVYSCRNDSYAFSDNSLQRLEWLELPGIREHWLYRKPADTLPGRVGKLWYLGQQGQGLLPGSHSLVVRAFDQAGNASEVLVPLNVVEMHTSTAKSWQKSATEIVIDQPGLPAAIRLTPFYSNINPAANQAGRLFLSPNNGDPVLEPTTLWSEVSTIDPLEAKQAQWQGLQVQGSLVKFSAANWPLDAALTVALPAEVVSPIHITKSSNLKSYAVYKWDGKEWDREGNLMPATTIGGLAQFALTDPGLYGVMLDIEQPAIVLPEQRLVITAESVSEYPGVSNSWWRIFPINIIERGAGIDAETIKASIDGVNFVVEPDLPRNRVLVELPPSILAGEHKLVLSLSDRGGNSTTAQIQLEVR